MLRTVRIGCLTGIVVGIALFADRLPAQAPGKIDFGRDVQPLFRTYCYGCHGPAVQTSNFRLDRRRDSLPNRVGANGARVVPGNAAASRLYLRIAGQAGLQMPPTGALSAEQIGIIKAWIDQGAEWPDDLANEAPSAPHDPQGAQIMEALRRGDQRSFERLLAENPKSAKGQGAGGATPLMYAALYGDADGVRMLFQNGADANTRNDAGATALLWAVDSPEVTRLLLEHGADPNIRSADGLTPLLLAAGHLGSTDVLKLLLDHGARLEGQAAVARAAAAGDEAALRLLIERGAEKNPLPGDLAIRSGCQACIDLLLPLASKVDLDRALAAAARFGDSNNIEMLLDRGAGAGGAALRSAAASEKIPTEGVKALLAHGARDDSALALAKRQGNTPVVAALQSAGAKEIDPLAKPGQIQPAVARSARTAVAKSLPLLQHADVVFLRKAGCVSCHNNSLTEMTLAVARKKGFSVDEAAALSQLNTIRAYLETWRDRSLQDIGIPGGVDTDSYILAGLAAANYSPDAATDAIAIYLKRRQAADGGWRIAAQRPPIESSDFEATAIALRALQVYAPQTKRAEYAKAIQRGALWLSQASPSTNEDYAYRLLGLTWAGGNQPAVRKAARELIELQRPDGGWAQLGTLSSDAYATGQALTALAEAGGMAVTDPVYQRGVQFLLRTQLEDGSWYVATRTLPVQPYFDSEFPHERDQFISDAATNWAIMALIPTASQKAGAKAR
ncbi:MAG TPA: ankyrin repeat domain-containing protein [Bryobacteraceae bacterium]